MTMTKPVWLIRLQAFISRHVRGYSEYDKLDYRAEFIRREYKPFMEFYRHVKNHGMSIPANLETQEEYITILDEIAWTFEWIYNDEFNKEDVNLETYMRDLHRAENGLKLFAEYFFSFWD